MVFLSDFNVWRDLIHSRLLALEKDVTLSIQLFVNHRAYAFNKEDSKYIAQCIESQLNFVHEAYKQGTPAGLERVYFEAKSIDTIGTSKQEQAFRRLAKRRIGIRLLPHIASIGTASRRTSYAYPYELGVTVSEATNEIVAPLLITVKKTIDQSYVISDFDNKCRNFSD